jgi:plastocyanin
VVITTTTTITTLQPTTTSTTITTTTIFGIATTTITTSTTTSTQLPTTTIQKITKNTVEITSSGFNPSSLTVNTGDTVTFINRDTKSHWPASAVHPTHKGYPETGGCIGSKFDACMGLAQGETFSFTFSQKGTWKYHDHLNPAFTGTIVVQDTGTST